MLIECGVAQIVARPSTVRQAQVDSCPGTAPGFWRSLYEAAAAKKSEWAGRLRFMFIIHLYEYVGDDVQKLHA